MQDIEVFPFFISLIMILFSLSMFLGIFVKGISLLLVVIAYPMYLSIYIVELFSPPFAFLNFNISNKNPVKFMMNLCAAYMTIILGLHIHKIIKILEINSEKLMAEEFISTAIYGHLYNKTTMIIFIVCLAFIYVLSYFFSEKDMNDPWTKIENISIPSLWKNLYKGL